MTLSFFNSLSDNRVATKLQLLERQITSTYPKREDLDDIDTKTISEINAMIDQAKIAVDKGEQELAWQLVHSIQRTMLRLDSESTLAFKKSALINEANSKLKGWRKKTVLDNLKDRNDDTESAINVDTLTQAYQILHDHFSNVYIKNRKILTQLLTLSVTAFIALLLFLLTILNSNLSGAGLITSGPAFAAPFIVSALLFGIMGACISGIFSLAGSGKSVSIPEMQIYFWITLSRPLVGAISALAIYLFMESGLIFPNLNITVAGMLAVSFAAGFTERIIIHAVKMVSDQDIIESEDSK